MVRRSNSKCAMIIISLVMIIAATQLLAATPETNWCGTSAAPGPASVLSRGYGGERTGQSPPVTLALAWGAETSVPETIARYAHAQDPDNPASLYVICGVSSGSQVNHTWRYDVGPGTWTALANAPVAVESPDAVITGGKLYLLGGTSSQMSIYDIAANSWSAGPALPRTVSYCAVGCYSGMIYMIGGDDNMSPSDGVSNVVNIFDVAANAWTGTGTPMPTATSATGYFQIGSYLYIVGGWGAAYPTNVNAVQRYNMATDTWSTGPAIPNAPADFTLAGNSQKLYAIGGDSDGGGYWDSSSQVQSLDLSTWPAGSWVADTSLPYAVQAMNSGFCTPAAVGGTHWLVGGLEGATFTFHSEVYSTPSEACASSSSGCTEIYDNGSMVTLPGGGPGGSDVSRLQTGLGMNSLGFGHAVATGYRIADDFTVTDPAGWQIDEIDFYAYQTGSTTTSSINHVNFRIWDGPPNDAGSAVIFGDTTTNRLASTEWSNIYRDAETTPGDTTRPVMTSTCSAGILLSAGTYWLDWQTGGTLGSGPWAPPITVTGQTTTGNALQYNGSTWSQAQDSGTLTQQGFPFTLYDCSGGGGCPTITIDPATLPAATVGVAYSQTVTASGGTAPYTFEVTMGTLPPGLTLDPATGILSGTPTTGGSFTFTINAVDSSACTGTITYTINFDYNWNLSVVDDAGRSSACLNTDTGYYAWTVLTGFGSGTYVGRSNVTFSNNTYYFQSGKPSGMNLKVSLTTNKASGTYMTPPLREKSICIDNDITDSPACP